MGRNTSDFESGQSHPPLTEAQKHYLDFGRKTWRNPAERENDIHSTYGLSGTQYFLKLHTAISHPEAAEYAPDVVAKMNEIIEEKKRSRRKR